MRCKDILTLCLLLNDKFVEFLRDLLQNITIESNQENIYEYMNVFIGYCLKICIYANIMCSICDLFSISHIQLHGILKPYRYFVMTVSICTKTERKLKLNDQKY